LQIGCESAGKIGSTSNTDHRLSSPRHHLLTQPCLPFDGQGVPGRY
jgi:hypothetical protein